VFRKKTKAVSRGQRWHFKAEELMSGPQIIHNDVTRELDLCAQKAMTRTDVHRRAKGNNVIKTETSQARWLMPVIPAFKRQILSLGQAWAS
jgi:hypothetical protein